jgi:hypothetical protein
MTKAIGQTSEFSPERTGRFVSALELCRAACLTSACTRNGGMLSVMMQTLLPSGDAPAVSCT